VVFLAQQVTQKFFPHNSVFQNFGVWQPDGSLEIVPGWLPLSVEGLARGYVWQLITYQFMHGGWLHLLGNCWVIYLFGQKLEPLLGGKKFLTLMLASGVAGGVFQVMVALLWPQYFGGAVVGASASGFGLVAAYALIFPEIELTLWLFPVTFRARTLLLISLGVALAGFAFPHTIMPGVAHAAHLGGMAMGWFYVRMILQGRHSRLESGPPPEKRFQAPRSRIPSLEEPSPEDFLRDEVDPILDKISAQGIKSLTPREREVLETARKHIRRP